MRCAGRQKCRLNRTPGAMAMHIHTLRIIWESPGRAGGLPRELMKLIWLAAAERGAGAEAQRSGGEPERRRNGEFNCGMRIAEFGMRNDRQSREPGGERRVVGATTRGTGESGTRGHGEGEEAFT
jgi:hypothetical protein